MKKLKVKTFEYSYIEELPQIEESVNDLDIISINTVYVSATQRKFIPVTGPIPNSSYFQIIVWYWEHDE